MTQTCTTCRHCSSRRDEGRCRECDSDTLSAWEEGLQGTQREIVAECDAIREMLLAKNRRYGDSALDPIRLFSQADPVEQIRVRIDDKLSRLRSAQSDDGEDAELDLIGYLVLLRIARCRRQKAL